MSYNRVKKFIKYAGRMAHIHIDDFEVWSNNVY